MKIYLINLARRPDRLAAMQAEAARLGLALTRIDAVDAKTEALPQARFEQAGPLGEIPAGDKACFLSHEKAWQALVASGEDHAVILEDDVILSPSAARFLNDTSWIPAGVDLVKLEHYGPASQSVLLSDFRKIERREMGAGFAVARMHSRHTGGAAYIVSRRASRTLVAQKRIALPVDHLLFNPNNSPLARELQPWQLLPAIARQKDFVGAPSDIEKSRKPLRKLTLTYIKRELVRFGYDLKLLPRQIALALTGKAKFTRIRTDQ